MNRINDIKNAIRNLPDGNDPDARERVRDAVLEEFDKVNDQSAATKKLGVWRIFMHSKISKFAAVAVIIIAVLIGVNHFGGSIDGASVAWARMLENVRKAHSVRHKVTYVHLDGTSFTNTVLINRDGVKRVELIGGGAMIFYPNKDFTMNLWDNPKRAFISRRINSQYPMIDMLQYTINSVNRASEYIGREMIDGQEADLYISEWRLGKNSVWVDPQTELPIRVEREDYPDPNRIYPQFILAVSDFGGEGGRSGATGGGPITVIKSEFEWNVEFDESLFSEEPPEGYEVTEEVFNACEPNETHVVEALQFWADYHEGQFPESIRRLGDEDELKAMLIEEFDYDGDPEKEYKAAFDYGNIVLKAIRFIQDKMEKSNWFYDEDVLLGEAEKPVCWWELEEGGYRIIFGDMSIQDMNEPPR